MKFKITISFLVGVLISVSVIAHDADTTRCDHKLLKQKNSHIIEIDFKKFDGLPYFEYEEMDNIPYGKPIYLTILHKKDEKYKVQIDTIVAKEINPLDLLIDTKKSFPALGVNKKKTRSDTSSCFYLGTFDQGKQAELSISKAYTSKTQKKTITKNELDLKFISKTLQKGKENHNEVNLLDTLKSNRHPNKEFLIKVNVEKKVLDSVDVNTLMLTSKNKSSEIVWKSYSDIYSIYKSNGVDTTTQYSLKLESWKPAGTFSFHIPKRYRFRIRAGFSTYKYETESVNIDSRKANSGDIDGLDNNSLPLGFRTSQFTADTTHIYRITSYSTDSRNYSPILMLSYYPLGGKSLSTDNSIFGTIFNQNKKFSTNTISQSLSLHVGIPINDRAFENYFFGFNLELLRGLDVGISYFTYKTNKLNLPVEYQDETLNGGRSYFTNSTIPNTNEFITSSREGKIACSVSVDAAIFQQAFASLFNTIKTGIIGK